MTDNQKIHAAERVFGGTVRTSTDPVKSFDREEHETKDRSKLAGVLIHTFLAGIGIILVLTPIYNCFVLPELRLDLVNLLTTYTGILGPFVGVIAGYYFKN